MSEYLDVLVLCSDPVDLRRTLNLGQELVHFEQVIRRSQLPIRLKQVFPPTLDQLRKEFAQAAALHRQPSIFHFLGHGDDDGLYFETEHGESHLVKGHELREVLAKSPVQLVLLNACWSATKRGVSLCDFLIREKVAKAAIGHERPVADVSAIEFAKQFYTRITQGETIREAYQRGSNALAEQGKSGAAEVELVGSGDLVLTTGLAPETLPSVIESGLPKFGYLPEPPVFYGRGDELIDLSKSFADAELAGFGLWGIGGIGKTALAKVAARRNAWRYEAAIWVDIRDATHKTTAELLRLALCRMHPGASDADPAFELVRRMQQVPSLIILDNLEDLPDGEHAALARFLQQIPRNGSRVLLTARVPLREIEILPNVPGRRVTEGLDTWNGASYVQYVARQKGCVALRDELREEGNKLEGLCALVTRRLHGHPKMLELAVGVAMQGREKLEQALVSLPDDVDRQLAALLATSLQFLGDDGNRVLPLLAFFPTGSMTPEALDVVGKAVISVAAEDHTTSERNAPTVEPDGSMGGDASQSMQSQSELADEDVATDDTEPDLQWLIHGRDQLVAAGLLDYDQTQDVYHFHQSVLDKAHARRLDPESAATATTLLLVHYSQYMKDNHDTYEQLDRCFENAMLLMESLWRRREGDGPVDAVLASTIDALGNYFHRRGLWKLGEEWHERVIELRQSSPHARSDDGLAFQLLQQGQVLAAHSRPDEAREMLAKAFSLFESLGNQRGLSASLHELAHIESSQGNPSEARRLLQRSIMIDKSLGDQRGLSASLHQLAIIESSQGNPSEARRLLQRSMTIKESFGDQRGLSASLHQLANIEVEVGNRDEARRLWERSIRMKDLVGDVAGAATTRIMLAQVEGLEGRFQEAIELATRSVRDLEQLGYASADQAREILRSIEELAGQKPSATSSSSYVSRMEELLAVWKTLSPEERSRRLSTFSDPVDVAIARLSQSVVCWGESDLAGCDAALAQAKEIASSSGNSELQALVETMLEQRAAAQTDSPAAAVDPKFAAAMQMMEQGDFHSAKSSLQEALAAARAAESPLNVAICQCYLGQILLASKEPAAAVDALRESLELATTLNKTDLIAAVQNVLTVAVRAAQEK